MARGEQRDDGAMVQKWVKVVGWLAVLKAGVGWICENRAGHYSANTHRVFDCIVKSLV
jgi:hypothetical protein